LTHSRRQLLDLLDRHHLDPSRALGQNFVADPNTVRRIARLARVGPGDRVVEIGAGLGSLTLALAETGAQITAIEIDRYVLPVLRELVEPVGVRVLEGDAADLDWADALDDQPHVLVANLPYNVATSLVLDLLANVPALDRMLVMVQREVAERLAAPPGSRTYGIPTVKRAWWADARVLGSVPPSVFVPRPRVESALLEVVRHKPLADDPAPVFKLVDAGFGQRRKMLRSSLAGRIPPETFARAGVDPTLRAEALSVHDWLRLARQATADAGADG
jgi:16S rRNA (adenine1518-N6/adenine1519-N6)-dimethyltransferase